MLCAGILCHRHFTELSSTLTGVLWWDSALQEQAWREFTAEVRGHAFSSEEMATHVHGRNNRHTLEYLTERTLSDTELAELTEAQGGSLSCTLLRSRS